MIEIIIPFPDPRLNPNRSKGTHWAATGKIRKDAREYARWMGRGVLCPPLSENGTIAVAICFSQPDKRRRDRDNLLAALKPSLDGIADALGINDSQFGPVTINLEYGKYPGFVRVEIGT